MPDFLASLSKLTSRQNICGCVLKVFGYLQEPKYFTLYFAIVFLFDMREKSGVAQIGLTAGAQEISGFKLEGWITNIFLHLYKNIL